MVNIFSWKEAFVWLLGSPKPPKPGIAQPRNVIFWHPHCFNFVVENPRKLPRDSGVQFGWYLNVQKSKLNVFKIICLGMRAKVVIKFFKALRGKATDENPRVFGDLDVVLYSSFRFLARSEREI